jgi:hypothetical protein
VRLAVAKAKRVLTEAEWEKVFLLRCKIKRGETVVGEDWDLVKAAFDSDRKRYSALGADVFNATVPVGSSAKWRK